MGFFNNGVPSAKDMRNELVRNAVRVSPEDKFVRKKARKFVRKLGKLLRACAKQGESKIVFKLYPNGREYPISFDNPTARHWSIDLEGSTIRLRLRKEFGDLSKPIIEEVARLLEEELTAGGYGIERFEHREFGTLGFVEIRATWATSLFLSDLGKVESGDVDIADAYINHGVPLGDLVIGR